MNRFRMTLLLTAIVLFAWAGMASAEDPPPEHPVLEVTQWSTNWQNLHTRINNPSQETQSGKLVVYYIFHGQVDGIAYDITVPADSAVDVTISYPIVPLVVSVNVYEEVPDGVNEDPDPIAEIKVVDPDD